MTVVNEPGLYTLILSSRKPEAKAFKRWITHDVIPMIRKTGGYMTDSLLEISVLRVCRVSLLLQSRFYPQKSKWHICCQKGSQSWITKSKSSRMNSLEKSEQP